MIPCFDRDSSSEAKGRGAIREVVKPQILVFCIRYRDILAKIKPEEAWQFKSRSVQVSANLASILCGTPTGVISLPVIFMSKYQI